MPYLQNKIKNSIVMPDLKPPEYELHFRCKLFPVKDALNSKKLSKRFKTNTYSIEWHSKQLSELIIVHNHKWFKSITGTIVVSTIKF